MATAETFPTFTGSTTTTTNTTNTNSTSRIIVKNLPKRIDERRLSTHFSALGGTITDVKLMHTPSGVFRRFAFVGFATPSEAEAAVRHFNNTFIDTSKIEVMTAKAVGDSDIPRPWSRHSTGSSLNIEAQRQREAERLARKQAEIAKAKEEVQRKKAYLKSIYGGDDEDADLQKFIAASKSKSQTKTWENDNEDFAIKPRTNKAKKVKVVPVVNKKPGGEGQLVTKTHVTYASSDSDSEPVKNDDGSSDDDLYEDFIPNRPVSDDDLEFTETTERDNNPHNTKEPKEQTEPTRINPDLINETARLFVRNLSYSCGQEDLQGLFEPFGELEEIHVSLSRETKRPRGYAYVKFVNSEDAVRAYQQLDGSIFQGRLLHILPAEAKPVAPAEAAAAATGTTEKGYKQEKLAKQKATATNDFNWNSMFVRSDTVLSAIAEQLGVSKSEIMNPTSENLAIRLATAETHLIADTKATLAAEGVDLSVFSDPERLRRKSKTVIIAKNFSFDTERAELSKLFGKFGPTGRFILPPTKTMAVVEFLEANDAKTAFKALAYSKFRNSPLFLEFAPEGLLRDDHQTVKTVAADKPVMVADNNDNSSDNNDAKTNDTLYIKNVNFDTTEDTLRSVFAQVGAIKSLTIPKKRDPRKPDAGLLSMGFAFVQFVNPEHATLALDRLQGTLVDNHSLLLKRSASSQPSEQRTASKTKRKAPTADQPDATCLMARNVPFEATERELRALFQSFAAVKRVRLPRKFDGGHRGFAFIDFHNHQDAEQALGLLAHTHLYGRHLVLEWAKSGGGEAVEESRQKARRNAERVQSVAAADDAGDDGVMDDINI